MGTYVLEHQLGAGGMKEVWRATPRSGGPPVALAVLRRYDREQFENEVALARRVDSPHVARVIEGFIDEHGNAAVVSELCEGVDLFRLRDARVLTPGEAVALIAQMASGLRAIHAAHVLHRDVKPANAILTVAGVKVIDFGVSLPAMDEKTGPGQSEPPAGTLAYMAPETVTGEIDARIDTYALGVSLYQLVVGHLPMPNLGFHDWMHRMVSRLPLPSDELAGYDARVCAMFERLCEPAASRRPYIADVEEQLHALAGDLGGVAPTAAAIELDPLAPKPKGPSTVLAPLPFQAGPLSGGRIAPTIYPGRVFHVDIALPDPGRIVVGWPHLPIVALAPDGGGTRIRCFGPDGKEGMGVAVNDELRGGVVADLDGDGVGELHAWSDARVHVIDAAGRVRRCIDVPRRAGAEPWDTSPFAPIVLGGGQGSPRELAIGSVAIDGTTHAVRALAAGFEGRGPALDDALGYTGLSCHGAAGQRFRGDVGTPAAILARRGLPAFHVASLERVFDGRPTVALGVWGPGGHRVGGGVVGSFALETAPLSMYEEAQRTSHVLFDDHVAPLAALGDGPPERDVIVVPYLHNAPWFGPVLAAFDGEGKPRWRERLGRAMTGPLRAPPMLVDVDGTGMPSLLWGDAGTVHRRDAHSGTDLPPPRNARGTPVAALDLGGRGAVHLVTWMPDAIEATIHGPCLPGAVMWLPMRGDLWRSGTLATDGLPVGPRV